MEIFTKVTCPAAGRFRCPSFDKHSEKWTRFESSEHYRKNDLGLLFCNRRGEERCELVAVFMLSAPSTVTRLLRSRIPPNETRVTSNSVKVDCRPVRPVAMPGVSNNRPLMGRELISCVLMTWLISVLVGSITGVSLVTTTISPWVATFRVTSIVANWPTDRSMLL